MCWRRGECKCFSLMEADTEILKEVESRHLKWKQKAVIYRCKIFLFVNADLLNLFPQIPKPITLCILQKILFFCVVFVFFLPTLDTIIQNRKNCRTNTGRMLEYCTREEKYSRNNFIQLFIKRKIYTIDLFCKIKIHHAIYITSSELYYWIYQQFTVHFNCAHKKKTSFFFFNI